MKFHRMIAMAAAVAGCVLAMPMAGADVNQLQKDFQTPPDDARIMVRWWWFGPAVTKEGIERELKAMKAGGIGGVEVQSTYPLAVDGGTGESAVKNFKFLSPEHLEMLGFTAAKCKELGLRMDLTLGSGWPYGGPMFSAAEGAGRIETAVVQAAAGQATAAAPQQRAGRSIVAAFAGPAGAGGRGGGGDMRGFKEVLTQGNVAQLPAGFAGGEVIFFISGRTGMQVKRPASGAEGTVIDHLSAAVVDKFIKDVAEPEIKACGDNPPFAIFCDSLEVAGENWTDDFLAEFQKRRGYDLKPFLPALVGDIGEASAGVRHDYAETVTDIFNDNFEGKFEALAAKYHTRFRIQAYGSPPAGLYSYANADLPEGEGGGNGNWRTFRTTRYASSASHLMGLKVTSSETFTWLHQAPFRATPLDMKGEVDTHFLDGINQVICHGWPYTPNGVSYPGTSFYAAAVFDDKNPWYVAMPEVTGYIQRVSQMMREGTPANDIALYLGDSDLWARAGTGYSSMNATYTTDGALLAQVVDAGYDLDAWDDGMLAALKGKAEGGALVFGDVKYRVVVLPNVTNMPLETARTLKAFVDGGGILLATGRAPSVVPGMKATAEQQKELAGIMAGLFGAGGKGILVANPAQLVPTLGQKLPPDVKMDRAGTLIGEVHRHTADAEVYFLANTGDVKQNVKATFRVPPGLHAEIWNPLSGAVRPVAAGSGNGATTLDLSFEPLGSTVVVWTARDPGAVAGAGAAASQDISAGWAVTFGSKGQKVQMDKLISWTDVPGMRNFSGVAAYEKTVTATAAMVGQKAGAVIDLGPAVASGAGGGGRGGNGYVANVVSPVRDAAVVFVNGQRAGAAWCAPFAVDVSAYLKEGENTIRIEVGNTAVNDIAAKGFPNYNLNAIRAAYGNRFDPQNSQLLAQPLPSGLLGPIALKWNGK